MYILGISAYYHDSAACLLKEGEIFAAAQEERFTRIKHDADFPRHAVKFCLREADITANKLNYVVFYDKPFIKFERILESYLAYAPLGLRSYLMAVPLWIKKKLWIRELIRKELNFKGTILFPEHHEAHAASAFFPSPFKRASFLTMDGVGEWTTTSWGTGYENRVKIIEELHFPHSPGLLYSAFTYYTGFKVNSGEYKVMGLAPYGQPKYVQLIYDHLIDLKEDGSFKMNMDYFDYGFGLKMTSEKFSKLLGGPPRSPEGQLTQKEMDLARSIQEVMEEITFRMARHVKKQTGEKYLCLAGGVSLNCVSNGKLLRSGLFDDIWIQPASGDAGGAIGSAFIAYHHYEDNDPMPKRSRDLQKGSYLGTSYSNSGIKKFLDEYKLPYLFSESNELFNIISDYIIEGKVVGWFQGRMEFGPRALGNRSIIGDARSPEMQKKMNLKIKYRESFRPFAPSVLAEHASQWFDLDRESPYMLLVAEVKKEKQRQMTSREEMLWGMDKLNIVRSEIPAVTHIDYSARVQTVHKEDNPIYHALLTKFWEKTGCPVIVNTSFNVRGEPIVESPLDAYKCFMRTEMDVLVLGNYILYKETQPQYHDDIDWRQIYELD